MSMVIGATSQNTYSPQIAVQNNAKNSNPAATAAASSGNEATANGTTTPAATASAGKTADTRASAKSVVASAGQVRDPRDINQDGKVSAAELSTYDFKHRATASTEETAESASTAAGVSTTTSQSLPGRIDITA